MNRLVRISITLFIAASVMLVMVLMRLKEAKTQSEVARQNAVQMSYVGMGMAGIFMVGGIATLSTALVRMRKGKAAHG